MPSPLCAMLSAMDPKGSVPAFHQAATFVERGVCVPLTTPALQGARTRVDDRVGLELVVPNPAGGRGVYVLPWSGVRELCQPTVHDTRLHEVLAQAGPLTPRSMRTVARQVAIEGSAGREAGAAAEAAQAAEAESQRAACAHLLAALGSSPGEAAAEVQAVATLLDDVGLGGRAEQAALPLRHARLGVLRAGIAALADPGGDDPAKLAAAILPLIEAASRCAAALIAEARALANPVPALIAQWRDGPHRLVQAVTRPDWVLDGWDLPCALWRDAADDAARRTLLPELATLVPVLPREAAAWAPVCVDIQAAQLIRRTVSLNQDWRTGLHAIDLVARNEQMLALAT